MRRIWSRLHPRKLDDVIDSIEEAERIGGLTTLGIIPFVKTDGGAEAALEDAQSALSEAYRSLCTSLQFSTARGMPKSLLVTSADAAEGKSVTSLAITQHFSRLGLKVLLVDADMRNPSLHKRVRADNSIGLSSYLRGTCNPPDAIQKTDIANLAFLPSGPLPPNAADLLSSPRLMSMLTLSLQAFDLVVIDGPPVLGIADAPLLSNAAEATVFVIGAGIARVGPVRSALKRLDIAKSPLIGSVITRFDARRAGYGYGRYGYGYGYGFAYGDQAFSYGKSIPRFGSAASCDDCSRESPMSDTDALRVAIDLFHLPSQTRAMRARPLPKGTKFLLRLAVGDADAMREAQMLSDRPQSAIRQAAIFFVEQILLDPGADEYRTLGLDHTATINELRTNMALLLKWLHPDLSSDTPNSTMARQVIQAWTRINSSEKLRRNPTALARIPSNASHTHIDTTAEHDPMRKPRPIVGRSTGCAGSCDSLPPPRETNSFIARIESALNR